MKRKLSAAGIVSGILALVLLAGVGIAEIVRARLSNSLTDQHAADRWGGDTAQLSVFFPYGIGQSFESLFSVERSVDEKLDFASVPAPGSGRRWYYAASAEREMYASTARASLTLNVTVCAGDYFLIHQPPLCAGAYPGAGGANAGYIFLDEDAAWKLFGAVNVTGMVVSLGGAEYIVCGIGRTPDGTEYDEAYGTTPRAYVLSDSMAGQSVTDAAVFEAVMPDPVEGMAQGILHEVFPGDGVLIENSSRFGAEKMWKHLRNRSRLGVRDSAVVYPWWENIALVTEYRCASVFRVELICLAVLALLGLVWIVIAWKPAERGLKALASRIRDGAYSASIRAYEKRKKTKKRRRTAAKKPLPKPSSHPSHPSQSSSVSSQSSEPQEERL